MDDPIIESGELSKSDIIKFMGEEDEKDEEVIKLEDDDKKNDNKEDEDEDDEIKLKEEDEDEEDEDEIKLEAPDEEELELIAPVARKEILTAYPDLFKKFPYLEKAMYRDQKMAEIFPSFDDAKEAVTKAATLDKFESSLASGDLSKTLKAVKEIDENTFNKVVDNYLENLASVDEKAYNHVLGNVIKHTISAMVRESKNSDNKALLSAATLLNQFVFMSSEFVPPAKLSKELPENNEAENRISQREQEFNKRQFESARDIVNTKIDNVLNNTIIENIDPKNSMTSYVKKNATREVKESVQNAINQDGVFQKHLDRLWENAFQNDFNDTAMGKIRSAYLSKGKTLLPAAIKSARNEALKGLVRNSRPNESDNIKEPRKKGTLPVGRSTSSNTSGKSDRQRAKEIPRGMSSREFLMQDD